MQLIESELVFRHGKPKVAGFVSQNWFGKVRRHLIFSHFCTTAEAAISHQIQSGGILIGNFGDEVADALAAEEGEGELEQFLRDAAPAVVGVHNEMIDAPAGAGSAKSA